MIIGLGIDIIEVARMRKDLKTKEGLLEEIFTPGEIEYCQSKRYPEQHFAARFCAKEAVFKALGTGKRGTMRWRDIEILGEPSDQPRIQLYKSVEKHAHLKGARRVLLSLTHTREWAAAVVLIEGEPETT